MMESQQINPEWISDKTAQAMFGLSQTRMWELRRDGLVRWKRLPVRAGGSGKSCRIINSVSSIRQWIESLPDAGESPQPEAGEMAATNQNR